MLKVHFSGKKTTPRAFKGNLTFKEWMLLKYSLQSEKIGSVG